MNTIDNSRVKCCMCKLRAGKYKCPNCSKQTCKLDCYKQHKAQFNCPGKLVRTKFIKKSRMGLQTLKRDKFFLTNQINKTNKVARALSPDPESSGPSQKDLRQAKGNDALQHFAKELFSQGHKTAFDCGYLPKTSRQHFVFFHQNQDDLLGLGGSRRLTRRHSESAQGGQISVGPAPRIGADGRRFRVYRLESSAGDGAL